MQAVTIIDLDIAKSVFQVHGIDLEGRSYYPVGVPIRVLGGPTAVGAECETDGLLYPRAGGGRFFIDVDLRQLGIPCPSADAPPPLVH